MSGIKMPANAAARDVQRMREENVDLEEQIRVLRAKQLSNSEMMGQLSYIAEWTEESPEVEPEEPTVEPEPEYPAEEPTVEPEPEPETLGDALDPEPEEAQP